MEGFQIFNASAGSGKTYQLTKVYLKLLLSNNNAQRFRRILALTFTNKAVSEMKQRILDSLWEFGNPNISKTEHPLFLELQNELGFSYQLLEEKSAVTLKLLLHNYDFFEVSTIDKFTHRVIKTFAKDLKIAQNFEVELDADLLLDEAIGRLLQNLSESPDLQNVLINFALEKVDANKSWNIVYDLKEIGKLLFNENHYQHIKKLKAKSIEDFGRLKKNIREDTKSLSKKIIDIAEEVLTLIKTHQLEFSDFTAQRFPKFMNSLLSGNQKIDFNADWKKNFETKPLYNKSCPDAIKSKLDELHPTFSRLFQEIKQHFNSLSFLKNVYKNLLPLTILNEIGKEISDLQDERAILHISEFNKLISEEIANQPVPYIYERLGERYRHYFIDEFQDTSHMQWLNLIPLIGNSLETEDLNGEKGSLMLVGDAKQSIYRWRGGDPEQFLKLSDLSENPFSVKPKITNLSTNWRSFEEVITFNNGFFAYISSYLKEERYNHLFLKQSQQTSNDKNGGYVEIALAPENTDSIADYYCKEVLQTIRRIIEKGYAFQDICILVRKNKHGILLADFLAEHQIPLISSEALLLQNNAEVAFLVHLLHYLDNPSEKIHQFEILHYFFKNEPDKHDRIASKLGQLSDFLKLNYDYAIENEVRFPLLTILERAIVTFDLVSKSGGHVFHFLDLALEFSQKQNVSVHGFLNYWELKKSKLAISAPNHQNAVQIMSVHKSKGLEFEFVIFPFADEKINSRLHQQKLWIPFVEGQDLGFNEILVNATKDLEHYSPYSQKHYEDESHLSELDDFNVLYVALTRAVKGLFVLSNTSKNYTYGALFKAYLQHLNLWNTETERYTFGVLQKNSSIPKFALQNNIIPYIYTHLKNAPKFAFNSQSLWQSDKKEAKQWGTLLHSILAEVMTKEDLDVAIQNAIRKGELEDRDKADVKALLFNVINHPELSKFYSDIYTSLNEVELLDVDGITHRPDRLILDGASAVIIDYKTGEERPEHQKQLERYAELIQQLDTNLIVDHKILVYIGDTIKPVFI